MREYVKKPESQSRTLDSKPKVSRQAPINVILQRYKERNIQRYAEDEELIQGKLDTAQRKEINEDELLQGKFEDSPTTKSVQLEEKPNNTGLPDNLKSGIENLSGCSMDDVKVHYNSPKPAQLQTLAYAQGTDIHVASGQEKHLPHEAWHVVQQKQGRVQPTMQMQGVNVNDNEGLEKEADVMGDRINSQKSHNVPQEESILNNVIQAVWINIKGDYYMWDNIKEGLLWFHHKSEDKMYYEYTGSDTILENNKGIINATSRQEWMEKGFFSISSEDEDASVISEFKKIGGGNDKDYYHDIGKKSRLGLLVEKSQLGDSIRKETSVRESLIKIGFSAFIPKMFSAPQPDSFSEAKKGSWTEHINYNFATKPKMFLLFPTKQQCFSKLMKNAETNAIQIRDRLQSLKTLLIQQKHDLLYAENTTIGELEIVINAKEGQVLIMDLAPTTIQSEEAKIENFDKIIEGIEKMIELI